MTTGAQRTATVTDTSEHEMVRTQPISYSPMQGNGRVVYGGLAMTAGGSAGTVTMKLYRGAGIAGTLIYTSSALSLAADAVRDYSFLIMDPASNVATNQYTLSATFSVAPGNSGAVRATIAVHNFKD